MDPMMSDILEAGLDVEFHVIVLSNGIFADPNPRYRDLARATGGQFLSLAWSYLLDGKSQAAELAFLNEVEVYLTVEASGTERARLVKKRQYELDLQKGEATEFEWYDKLPGH